MFLPIVPGQDLAKRYFERALRTGRLSHAYLFLGPEGAGKRLFARELVKAFFCETGRACGDCVPCRSVAHGNHPAVEFHGPAEGKTVIDIETVRNLCSRAHYKSRTIQVAVLQRAELLSEPAANALLKTLEEPPGDFILILTAQSAGSLLSTIVSRCHRVLFIGAAEEGEAVDPSWIAEARDPGFFARRDVREWMSEGAPKDIGASRLQVRRLLDDLVRQGRAGIGSRTVGGPVSPPSASLRSAPGIDGALRHLERLLDLRQDLDRNVNPELVLEMALGELRRPS